VLSLACVVKEGEFYCHIFLKFVRICNVYYEEEFTVKSLLCKFLHRRRLLKEGESIILEGELFC
jgi:hypothetical protein